MADHSAYTNVKVPGLCKAIYGGKMKDSQTHMFKVYQSPMGPLAGITFADLIHTPGMRSNVKVGDKVKVLMHFTMRDGKMDNVAPGSESLILGVFQDHVISDVRPGNPLLGEAEDRIGFVNEKGMCGLTLDDAGHVLMASGSSVMSLLRAGGYGTSKDSKVDHAQNFHRSIANNRTVYMARDHFGMYSGSDDMDESTKSTPDSSLIVFRRFVTQTRDIKNWVSTCEGSFSPWVGANINIDKVKKSRETLYSKVINHDKVRLTIEAGNPGVDFFKFRIDDVKVSESVMGGNVVPGSFGNRFKMTVSDKGAVDIVAGGGGTAVSNTAKTHISIDAEGNIKVQAAGTIEFAHDESGTTNSIKMDPANGIDVKTSKGFRINGDPVVMKQFIDWMDENKNNLWQVTSIGGPAPIHPKALPDFSKFVSASDKSGFLSVNNYGASDKAIQLSDSHSSV